jgi:membrane associated rhomboid family serine protease
MSATDNGRPSEIDSRVPIVTVGLILINFIVFYFLQGAGTHAALTNAYSMVPREIITGYHLVGKPSGDIQEITGAHFTDAGRTLDLDKVVPRYINAPIEIRRVAEAWFPELRASSPNVTLFTSMFLHLGWPHVVANMAFLFCLGPPVERILGPIRFLVLYVGAGLFAGFVSALGVWAGDHALESIAALTPNAGASGAVAGILGCFLALRPKGDMYLVHPLEGTSFLIPTLEKFPTWVGFVLAAIWAAVETWVTFGDNPYAQHTNHPLHFLGVVTGVALATVDAQAVVLAAFYLVSWGGALLISILAHRWGHP